MWARMQELSPPPRRAPCAQRSQRPTSSSADGGPLSAARAQLSAACAPSARECLKKRRLVSSTAAAEAEQGHLAPAPPRLKVRSRDARSTQAGVRAASTSATSAPRNGLSRRRPAFKNAKGAAVSWAKVATRAAFYGARVHLPRGRLCRPSFRWPQRRTIQERPWQAPLTLTTSTRDRSIQMPHHPMYRPPREALAERLHRMTQLVWSTDAPAERRGSGELWHSQRRWALLCCWRWARSEVPERATSAPSSARARACRAMSAPTRSRRAKAARERRSGAGREMAAGDSVASH